uniref:Neuropeptide FF receptor 1-like n=1 Tax=Sinocyclocheilus rhinocerous TaxID=307959 RepID=A0A673H0D9_9TELE
MDLNFFYSENISINHSTLFNDSRNLTLLPFYQHSLAVASVIMFIAFYVRICSTVIKISLIYITSSRILSYKYQHLQQSLSDLLVGILCLPITLVDNLITGWPFDVVTCKMSGLVQGASVSASVFTLVAIAVERFRCIVYPFQRKLTQRQAIITITFIWALAVGIMCPSAVTLTVSQDLLHFMVDRDNVTYPLYTCWEAWPDQSMRKIYTTVLFSHIYLAPVTLIVIMYTRIAVKLVKSRRVFRRKLRVVNMLLIVALLFTVSWLPLWILMMLTDYGNLSATQLDLVAVYVFPFAHWLAFFNSSVNPIVYGYFNENFRRGFQAAFKMGLCLVDEPPQPRRNDTWKHNRVFADRDRPDAQNNGRREFCSGEQRDELVLEDLD